MISAGIAGERAACGRLPRATVSPPAATRPGSRGILGGTFDPIHHGHLAIAEEVREALGLERVVFVPSNVPPHRPDAPRASANHRLAMVRLAVAENPAFEVSDLEVRRPGPSYTVDTLRTLAGDRVSTDPPGALDANDLVFVLSSEAFEGFGTWRDPEGVLRLATLAIVPRDGHDDPDPAAIERRFGPLASRVTLLPGPLLAISGSAIRARAAARRSLRYLVPDAVARYIGDHDLYTTPGRTSAP
ncbi:MAG: nicotinate-nucleotide adenylyltransferase [Chloroflexota bacterium]